MYLYILSLYVPCFKFVLSSVSPELRNYDVLECAMNHKLRKYYIDVSDHCPKVVEHTVVQYCPPKH